MGKRNSTDRVERRKPVPPKSVGRRLTSSLTSPFPCLAVSPFPQSVLIFYSKCEKKSLLVCTFSIMIHPRPRRPAFPLQDSCSKTNFVPKTNPFPPKALYQRWNVFGRFKENPFNQINPSHQTKSPM